MWPKAISPWLLSGKLYLIVSGELLPFCFSVIWTKQNVLGSFSSVAAWWNLSSTRLMTAKALSLLVNCKQNVHNNTYNTDSSINQIQHNINQTRIGHNFTGSWRQAAFTSQYFITKCILIYFLFPCRNTFAESSNNLLALVNINTFVISNVFTASNLTAKCSWC